MTDDIDKQLQGGPLGRHGRAIWDRCNTCNQSFARENGTVDVHLLEHHKKGCYTYLGAVLAILKDALGVIECYDLSFGADDADQLRRRLQDLDDERDLT